MRNVIQDAEQANSEDFIDALRGVASGKGRENISPDRLGWWLKRHLNTVITLDDAAFRFTVGEHDKGRGQRWRLERL